VDRSSLPPFSSFNNPLGCTMPEERKIAVLDLLAGHAVPLIEDDIYGDIYFGPDRPRPFMALDRRGNTNLLQLVFQDRRTGLPHRVDRGRALHAQIMECKLAFTLCGAALPQAALADFLSSGGYDSHLRRIRRTFADNIDQMIARSAGPFPRARGDSAAGGFLLWLELHRSIDSRAMFGRALEKASASHRAMCSPPAIATPFLRLSCGTTWDARIEGAWDPGQIAAASRARTRQRGAGQSIVRCTVR